MACPTLSNIITSEKCGVSWSSPENESFWFGYYNYSPVCKDGSKVLAHRSIFEGRMSKSVDKVEIGYFDLSNGTWKSLGYSGAFNWQQGSMLQWLGPDFNTRVIYNDVENNHFVSRIIDIKSGKTRTIPEAIYAIDPHGRYSITLNFERCYWTRAYSYASICNKRWDGRHPEGDGIFRIDLITGEKIKIISLESIVRQHSNEDVAHWFEHIQMNLTGTRFSFYYRFGEGENFVTQAYTSDCFGNTIWKHPLKKNELLSHFGWRSDKEYVIFIKVHAESSNVRQVATEKLVKNKNFLSRSIVWCYRKFLKKRVVFRGKIEREKRHFYAFTSDQNGFIDNWSGGLLSRDGHPSFTKNGRYMLTDTYEDSDGFRHLYLYDSVKKTTIFLAKLFSTYNSCGWRADLHPRFSPDEKKIIVDSTHNGYHQIVIFDVYWNKI